MKYKIDAAYCWYNRETTIVLMYFINGIPFTFDELPHTGFHTIEIVEEANQNRTFEPEDIYQSSYYLIMEECHPLMFEVDLENPEALPVD
jgi:hypothetical protein